MKIEIFLKVDKNDKSNEEEFLGTYIFRDALLESFIVDDMNGDILLFIGGRQFIAEDTEENRDKLSMILENKRYDS
jgi:hypothetical protein